MKGLLGVDIGTTSLKACVFDEKGRELASTTKAYKLITEGEFVEFPAENYFELFLEAFEELSKKTKIDALAIDTQGETIIFLDKTGAPLMNAIVWLDNRAEKEAREIEKKFGLRTIYETTGQTEVPAGYPAPKIAWLRNNRREIFDKVDKIVLLEDYLIYRLTGEFYAERSLYSSTLYLDIRNGEYFTEMLVFIGITENQLPKLKESGEKVGSFRGVSVSMGALDQIAGFTGSGINKEGVISEMTGTCLAVCALSKTIPPYFEGIKVPAYYVEKGKYCLLMFASTAGMVMEWFRKTFYDNADYKIINEDAEKVELGSEGLTFYPNMCGQVMPENDALIKGGIYGLELKHGKGHIARAIMESVAYLLRQYLDYLNITVEEIISIGGGAKSSLWLQIKADITGKKVCTLINKETGCLGTAIYAGIGHGVYKDRDSAVSGIIAVDKTILPKVDRQKVDKLYERYLELDRLLLSRNKEKI